MECWTYNKSRISNKCPENKSHGYDKQTDDFQERFPNFMTLTEEERREFFQTLYAAKIKLEKSGVSVKPQFGTVHDKSWNYSNALDIAGQNRTDSDVSVSSTAGIGPPEANIPIDFKCNTLISQVDPLDSKQFSREPAIVQKPGKHVKNQKIGITRFFSQENREAILDPYNTAKSSYSEKEGKIKAHKNNSEKSPVPSLSYEILKGYDGVEGVPAYQKQSENLLKISGRNLKVQVTLISADNERMRMSNAITNRVQNDDGVSDKNEKNSGETPNTIDPRKDVSIRFERPEIDKKQSTEEEIDDTEVKDLQDFQEEDKESTDNDEELPKEKKSRTKKIRNKKLREQKKIERERRMDKETKAKLEKKKKNPEKIGVNLEKDKEKRIKASTKASHDQLLLEELWRLENADVEETEERRFKGHTDSIVIIRKKKEKKTLKDRDNDKIQTRSKSSASHKESPEFKENSRATQQRVQTVSTVKEGVGSKLSLEKQNTEVSNKKQVKPARELRFKNEIENIPEREHSFRRGSEEENELKAQEKENLPESKREKKQSLDEEEIIKEENPEPTSGTAEKVETQITTTPEEIPEAVPSVIEDREKIQKEKQISETGKISDAHPTEIPVEETTKISTEEKKKVAEVRGSVKDTLEEPTEYIPSFKPGKVVFVDDNVIEKIKKVILDLEEKAKAEECNTKNEYLVLLVEYAEYLMTVMATLLENRILNESDANSCDNFDEENVDEMQQYLRASTSTTDFDSESECMERLKRHKPKSTSFVGLVRKFFDGGRKKMRVKDCNRWV